MDPILIKRYPNRRLYDTQKSSYITLDDLATYFQDAPQRVQVIETKTGDDITCRILVQVLLTDLHVHKLECLPKDFLYTLLELKDSSMLSLFEHYVKMTLSSFAVAQKAMQHNLDLFKKLAPGPSEFLSQFTSLLNQNKD